jgi:hypothetical protein
MLRKGAYVFTFGQKGLMAGFGFARIKDSGNPIRAEFDSSWRGTLRQETDKRLPQDTIIIQSCKPSHRINIAAEKGFGVSRRFCAVTRCSTATQHCDYRAARQ